MKFVAHVTPAHFLETAEPWLLRAEAEHGLLLGLARSRAALGEDPDPTELFATVQEGNRVVGCLFRTPPHPLGLTDLPESAIPLVLRQLSMIYPDLPAVVGPPEATAAFAEGWAHASGALVREGPQMEIRVLDEVVPPPQLASGHLRLAASGDSDLVEEWGFLFVDETGIGRAGPKSPARALMADDALYVWEAHGTVVSMAAALGATPRGIRIAYVYTPPGARGHGYATALVAVLSQLLLDRGFAFCFLYTDRANPTSSGIYERLGYRTEGLASMLEFVPASG